MLGRAAIAMWWDIPPPMQAEFEDWHSHEHMPERLGIPGFLRGTRWIALSGEPSYFVLYETSGLETLTGGAYLERLNDPTPWSRKMMPYHHNMVRSLCSVRASFGRGLAHALATIRFSPVAGQRRRARGSPGRRRLGATAAAPGAHGGPSSRVSAYGERADHRAENPRPGRQGRLGPAGVRLRCGSRLTNRSSTTARCRAPR